MNQPIRYEIIDSLRGLALLNMIFYHMIWDLVYLFDFHWKWYLSNIGYIWQQGICFTFIFLSGFCYPLSRHKKKRSFTIFLSGAVISGVTIIFMPQNMILFGILTLLGSCMFIMIPIETLLKHTHPLYCVFLSFFTFLLFRQLSPIFTKYFDLPSFFEHPFSGSFFAYLGFPPSDFFSTDYFPILPWFFLFITGYFFYWYLSERDLLHYLRYSPLPLLQWFGRHTLEIYMVHQPILFVCLYLILFFIHK